MAKSIPWHADENQAKAVIQKLTQKQDPNGESAGRAERDAIHSVQAVFGTLSLEMMQQFSEFEKLIEASPSGSGERAFHKGQADGYARAISKFHEAVMKLAKIKLEKAEQA